MHRFWGDIEFGRRGGRRRLPPELNTCFVSPSGVCLLSGVDSTSLTRALSIAGQIQLHNRKELIHSLGGEGAWRASNPGDHDLVLAAYEKWGTDCAGFLLGEFAFAIWDDDSRRLFCCRDQIGFRPFFFRQSPGRIVFADDVEPVLERSGAARRLNAGKLASFALPYSRHESPEETFYQDVFSLPWGSWMLVDGGNVRQQRYWDPGRDPASSIPAKPEQYVEGLRQALIDSVECRLDEDRAVTAMLSGGLDSSSVTGIAARCLEKKNRQLHAVSVVVAENIRSVYPDEREYIDEFRLWPNVEIQYVTAAARGPFDALNEPCRFFAHPFMASHLFLNQECEGVALANGSRRLLWGAGGELGASCWGERAYLDFALDFHWGTLLRELKQASAVRGVSALRLFMRQVKIASAPAATDSSVLLSADFERRYQTGTPGKGRYLRLRAHQTVQLRNFLNVRSAQRQTSFLVPPSLPLMDKRVLEYCLALPDESSVHNGYNRYQLRAALEGILPERIRWRTGKRPYSPDYFLRYNEQLGLARDFVAAIGPKDPVRSVVDVNKLQKLMQPVDPIAGSRPARDLVPVSCYLINYLRQFPEFQP